MVSNCRGNPAWLPILRAATSGRPYKFLFGSGLAGVGLATPSSRQALLKRPFQIGNPGNEKFFCRYVGTISSLHINGNFYVRDMVGLKNARKEEHDQK
jgi:hypothetical protein